MLSQAKFTFVNQHHLCLTKALTLLVHYITILLYLVDPNHL